MGCDNCWYYGWEEKCDITLNDRSISLNALIFFTPWPELFPAAWTMAYVMCYLKGLSGMEDNLTGRQPRMKMTSQEDNHAGRRPQRKTASQVDRKGIDRLRQPNRRDDLTGIKHHRMTTSQEDNHTGKKPQ